MASTQTTSTPALVKVLQPSKGKVGFDDKGNLLFPFFLMGCSGDERGLRATHVFAGVEQLDVKFWTRLAKAIESQAFCDWDWTSLRNNVIKPNEAHIRAVCNIPNPVIWRRFLNDGYVFLNRWFKGEADEDAEEGDEPVTLPCGANCFVDKDVEY